MRWLYSILRFRLALRANYVIPADHFTSHASVLYMQAPQANILFPQRTSCRSKVGTLSIFRQSLSSIMIFKCARLS